MSQSEVSVILLTYNQAATAARALESILAQKCDFPYEVIVGDDGSTDSTRAILAEIASRHPDKVKLLPEAPNKGVVDNYFDAFAQCSGRYIADCAGDDYWLTTDRLQRLHDIIDAHPQMTIVHSDWQYADAATGALTPSDPDGLSADLRQPEMSGRTLLTALLQHRKPVPIHLSAALYRADIVRKAMNDYPSMVRNRSMGCEDMPLTAALLAAGDVGYLDTPTLAYTIGGPSITSQNDFSRQARFQIDTTVATIRLARHYGVPICLLRKAMAEKLRYAMALTFHSHDRRMRALIIKRERQYGLPRHWRYKVLKLLTANNLLWNLSSKIASKD